jgi:predicted Zn-dependent protease
MDRFLRANGEQPLRVTFKRDGEDRTAEIKPVIGCAIPVVLEINPKTNAYTDYTKIVIYSSMLRLSRTDDQLATVVGHELAHVNMGHYRKQFQNELVGEIGGAMIDGGFLLGGIYTGRTFTDHLGLIGRRAFSVEFEREADYVGGYYTARAGYSVTGAEEIWSAFGIENPNSITITTTHPTTPVRFLQMRKTAEEIADKQRRNLPLAPELKMAESAAPTREDSH